MKKFTPPKKSKQTFDNLSPWQKRNLEYLENDLQNNQKEPKETVSDLTVETSDDLFGDDEKTEGMEETIHRYIKPTEIEDDASFDWTPPEYGTQFDLNKEVVPEGNQPKGRSRILNVEHLWNDNQKQEDTITVTASSEDEPPKDPTWFSKLKKTIKVQFLTWMTLLLMLAIMLFYYILPVSLLSSITVSGNHLISDEKIQATSKLTLGDRILPQYQNRQTAIQNIKKANPGIQSATIKWTSLTRLSVEVVEYKVVGYMLKEDMYYHPVLSNGAVLDTGERQVKQGTLIFKDFEDFKLLADVAKQSSQLPKSVKKQIDDITSQPTDDNPWKVVVKMKDGNTVYVQGDHLSKLKYYPQIKEQLNGQDIIDMEAGIYAYPSEKNKQRMSTTNNYRYRRSSSQIKQEVIIPTN